MWFEVTAFYSPPVTKKLNFRDVYNPGVYVSGIHLYGILFVIAD